MIERVVKSEQGKAIDPDEHLSSQPLNFQFYYANKEGKTEILNTFYLEDGNPKLDLYLEVFNESDKSITFQTSAGRLSTVQAGGTSAASAERCHFSLRWEKDIVIKPSEFSVEPKEWQVNYDEDDHFFTLYFFHKSGFVLRPQNSDNGSDRVLLTLKNFTANNRAVKSSNVEMLYGSPLLLNDGEVFTETLSIKNTISVTNHPDYKNIPLQVRFIGPNTILNDETTNSLKLQIVNRPPSNNTRPNLLLDKTNSKFIVSLETGESAEVLTTLTSANNIQIGTNTDNWKVDKTQNSAEWTVKLNNSSTKDKLVSGEAIALDITNIFTSNPSGVAYLYITYQNIGNYPDGQLVVPIEKTPLLYRGTQVGIGTTSPSAKLHVQGGDAIIGGKLTSTGDATIGGKVGIGTTSPSAKLEVKLADTTTTDSSLKLEHNGSNFTVSPHRGGGNNSTIIQNTGGGSLIINPSSGNVGIGTTAPSAKLHVSGGDAIVSGRLAIGTTVSSHIHLTIGDDDTGLKQQGDGKLAIYTNNAERVRIDENGNVAIGTTDLTHRLHIGGKNSTLRLSGEGNYGVGATLNFGDREEVYIKEDEDKKLLIHADTRISLESSVGIGTKNPSAKLDVNGSVKLGDGSTAWNRIICGKVIVQPGVSETQWRYYGKGIRMCLRTAKTGFFRIYFEKEVTPEKMVITVSTEYSYADNFVSVTAIHSDHFEVQTRDRNGGDEDASFHFIAIELTENFSKLLNSN
ncbi:hypothetical protein QUA43_26445 [Microcoleus sp. N9_B4]|uniref:hypothetical protein n=1 Tax=Microcoleus sp. N9_B4 TaxID=3055386 RepID=UPI002FD485E1